MKITATIRTLALAALFAAFVAFSSACNTVKGVGEDVSAAGQSLADVADDAKD